MLNVWFQKKLKENVGERKHKGKVKANKKQKKIKNRLKVNR